MKTPGHRGQNSFMSKTVLRLLLISICLFSRLGLHGIEVRGQGSATEYAVKAAFITKFRQFVKGPSGASLSNAVGLIGDDTFGGELDKVAKVKRGSRAEDMKGCQIVFIAKSERNAGGILSGLAGTNTLTVGEFDGFARQGGVIGFTLDGDKVRFEINMGAAKRNGLTIDPRLAGLAVRVIQ